MGQERLAGNIYKGVIESVVPGIGAIFVNIGTGKNGFLYIKDLEGKAAQTLLGEEIIIEKKMPRGEDRRGNFKKGQEVLVQVVKEPIGTKGPLLTSDISLPGKYVVIMPFSDTVGISKRIEDRGERTKLKSLLAGLNLPPNVGCIARTQSIGVSPRQVRHEVRYLMNLWSRIQKRAARQNAPSIVYEEYDITLRIIRDYMDSDIEKIMVDSREEYKKISRFAGMIHPGLRRKIFYYRGKTPLYENYGIENKIEEIFRRKIYLKSGGHIVIEQTESLVAVDVNTGKFTGRKKPEETAFRTNMEAASEIARQIMLRDIGGIIIIDFIDMREKGYRRQVYHTLENEFKRDKAKINIQTISAIGIVEMTRQRIRKSLESVSFRECPYCNGMGRVKTPETIAIEILRKLKTRLGDRGKKEVFLTLHPDVAEYLQTSYKGLLNSLERTVRKKIVIKREGKLHVEDFYLD